MNCKNVRNRRTLVVVESVDYHDEIVAVDHRLALVAAMMDSRIEKHLFVVTIEKQANVEIDDEWNFRMYALDDIDAMKSVEEQSKLEHYR